MQVKKPLHHRWLEPLFFQLQKSEQQQLADYIVSSYNAIDYEKLVSFFGSYEKMCLSFASNQGNEYEIKEEFIPGSHRVYIQISSILVRRYRVRSIKEVLHLPEEERIRIANRLSGEYRIPRRYLAKFLRVALK